MRSNALKHPYPFRIVPPMMRTAVFLSLTLLVSATALADQNQFGILLGGSKRISDTAGTQERQFADDFTFNNSVKEVYVGIELDPSTMFRIKAGQITAPAIFVNGTNRVDIEQADVSHVDALVDYRFSEIFGSTGLFAGVGMYRQSASGQQSETNVGLQGGLNADFPLSRRYGILVEAAYHWVNFDARPRYITLSGGLRISF